MESELQSDEELAQQAASDERAFVELYHRYFPHVYDLALRLSRDRDVAAMVAQASFFRVYQGLRTSPPPGSFRVQLFAIARRDLVERVRRHRGPVLEGEEPFVSADPSLLANPALAPELPELARIVWQTARGFKLEEYELLDLQIRQELEAHEIGTIVGSRAETVQGRIVRLRDAMEESFTAFVLLSRGRRECLDLDFLVGDEEWTPQLRRRVIEHLQSCQACQATRRRYPTAAEVLSTITPVPAPADWEDTILSRILQAARTGEPVVAPAPAAPVAIPAQRETMEPFPVSEDGGIGGWFRRTFGGRRGPLYAFLAGGLLVLIIALAALCGAGAFDGGGGADITPTPSPTATDTPTGTPTETPTATPTP